MNFESGSAYLVRISSPALYYRVISVFLLVVGIKLLWEGLGAV